jgi:ABC-type phosphate transport system ATPase subunit
LVPKSRILILTGPAGCGKLSLIRTYALSENKNIKYHIDTKLSFVEDLQPNYQPDATMPEDLIGLNAFIKEINVGAK